MCKRAIILLLSLCGPGCEDVRFTENPLQIDSFRQTPNPVVDILWVVDNSGTMRYWREKLGEKFDQFMSRLISSGADYHIGVVSTDADDPAHSGLLQGDPRFIDSSTSNPKEAFIGNVDLPETDNRREKGLKAMRLALSAEMLGGANSGFLRAEASLFVIVISDEDDSSLGDTRYYARWLEHQKDKGNENLASLSAIVGVEGCAGVTSIGERYLEVQELTGGLFYSICTEDYGPMVEALGIRAAGLRRKFYLSAFPRRETIKILSYSEGDPPCERMSDCSGGTICAAGHRCATKIDQLSDGGVWLWEQSDNSIFFPQAYLPAAGSFIEVHYIRGVR